MLESILKWAAVASLLALVAILAVQLAPRFIERAGANGAQHFDESSGPIVIDPAPTTSPRMFERRERFQMQFPDSQGAELRAQERDQENAQRSRRAEATEQPDQSPITPRERDHAKSQAIRAGLAAVFADASEYELGREFDVKTGDLQDRHGGDRFDVVREKLPARRFGVVDGDLPDRHEALMAQKAPGENLTPRYDTKRSALTSRHQGIPDPEPLARQDRRKTGPHVDWITDREADDSHSETRVQRYYLVPVPEE
jgi:hypothetical protein